MNNCDLDDFIEGGEISSYTYEEKTSVNRHNLESRYEDLILVFPSGRKIIISSYADSEKESGLFVAGVE